MDERLLGEHKSNYDSVSEIIKSSADMQDDAIIDVMPIDIDNDLEEDLPRESCCQKFTNFFRNLKVKICNALIKNKTTLKCAAIAIPLTLEVGAEIASAWNHPPTTDVQDMLFQPLVIIFMAGLPALLFHKIVKQVKFCRKMNSRFRSNTPWNLLPQKFRKFQSGTARKLLAIFSSVSFYGLIAFILPYSCHPEHKFPCSWQYVADISGKALFSTVSVLAFIPLACIWGPKKSAKHWLKAPYIYLIKIPVSTTKKLLLEGSRNYLKDKRLDFIADELKKSNISLALSKIIAQYEKEYGLECLR